MQTVHFQSMPDPSFDFLILTTQRSGSHMLASALNSHPSISCEGEITSRGVSTDDSVIEPSAGETRGAILMYNRWHTPGKFPASKIIHLVRNPCNTAQSRVANEQSKKLKGREHRAHYWKKVTREFEIGRKVLRETENDIKNEIYRMRKEIQRTSHMEISYEELTGNTSITQVPQESADRISAFLGVPVAPLIVDLVKPDTIYVVTKELK